MRVARLFAFWPFSFACQPAQSPPEVAAPEVVVAPAAGHAEPPPTPAEPANSPTLTSSAYLTAEHGCERVTESVGADLLRRGESAIARAGEHPSPADLDQILPLLHRAAYGGYAPAQRRYGYYVVGYWFTDEMFWPSNEPVAVSALAMVRVSAIHDRAEQGGPLDDALREAMANTPVTFADPDQAPALPDDWVAAAVAEADRWLQCVAAK